MKKALATLALLVSVQTQAITSGQFLEASQLDQAGSTSRAYLVGLIDYNKIIRAFKDEAPIKSFCPPDGATPDQAVAIAVAAIRGDPANWHRPAVETIIPALSRSWPCQP